jgi:hypothetical protein
VRAVDVEAYHLADLGQPVQLLGRERLELLLERRRLGRHLALLDVEAPLDLIADLGIGGLLVRRQGVQPRG